MTCHPSEPTVLGRNINFDLLSLVALYEDLARCASERNAAGAQHIVWTCTTLRQLLSLSEPRPGRVTPGATRRAADVAAWRLHAVMQINRWLGLTQGWLWSAGLRGTLELAYEARDVDKSIEVLCALEVRRCEKCGHDRLPQSFKSGKKACRACARRPRAEPCTVNTRTMRRREAVASDLWGKLCQLCHTVKPYNQFAHSTAGLVDVATYCLPCDSARSAVPEEREKKRLGMRKFRENNREAWLAKARVWGFERTNRRRVTNDGTVTDEFLTALYDTPCCTYCHKQTPRDKRTADHKVPLARGGAHSADNLVMACVKCNNRKHAKSAEVFIAQLASEQASGGEG